MYLSFTVKIKLISIQYQQNINKKWHNNYFLIHFKLIIYQGIQNFAIISLNSKTRGYPKFSSINKNILFISYLEPNFKPIYIYKRKEKSFENQNKNELWEPLKW